MARSSSERRAQRDGDDRGRREVLGDVPVLRIQGVAAHHLRIEHPQLTVDPAEVVLRSDDERRRVGPADGPAHGHRERQVAQLPEVLREPEGVRVGVPGDALLALPGGELADVRRVEGGATARIDDGVRPAAPRPPRGGGRPPRPGAPPGRGFVYPLPPRSSPHSGLANTVPFTASSIPVFERLPTFFGWLAMKPSDGTCRTGNKAWVVKR